MVILFLTNNSIAYDLSNWLALKEKVVIWESKLSQNIIDEFKPDFIISYNYKHIVPKDILDKFDRGNIINLHISLLPWNRGMYPNVWSFIDNTPKGVTIHIIDEGIDTGDILIQKEVYIDESMHTLRSSYELLHTEIQNLFKENWEYIKEGKLTPKPQVGEGSYHTKRDFERIRHILGDKGWDIPILEFKERIGRLRKCGLM